MSRLKTTTAVNAHFAKDFKSPPETDLRRTSLSSGGTRGDETLEALRGRSEREVGRFAHGAQVVSDVLEVMPV